MSNEFELDDWGDDPFGGDLDFDSDFDGKKKGLISSVASGFLSGIKDNTFGTTEGRIKIARMALPKSYGQVFDYARELGHKKGEIIRELQESSHGAITELQDLSKNILDKYQDKVPNKIAERMGSFNEKDFSSWEKRDYSSSSVANATMEETTDEDVEQMTLGLMSAQTVATNNLGKVFSKTMIDVGGRQLGQQNVSNQILGSIDTSLQAIVNFQRKVQLKNDAAKISLLSRMHLTNAKFYKFMEASMHRSIDELKGIAKSSAMSDFQKTSTFQATKGMLRQKFLTSVGNFGGIGSWTKGLMSSAQGGLDGAAGMLGNLNMGMQMLDGVPVNYGQEVGRMLGGLLVNNIPRLAGTQQSRNFFNKLAQQFPSEKKRLEVLYRKMDRFGRILNYGSNNAAGIFNNVLGKGWDYEEDITTYEDYLESLPANSKPMSKAAFNARRRGKNFLNGTLNKLSNHVDQVSGNRYNLHTRNMAELAENNLWTRQSDRTLNEVIPELLSKMYQSLEKIRTGNDNVEQQRYDYKSGRMVTQSQTRANIQKQLFGGQEMQWFARTNNDLASNIAGKGYANDAVLKTLAMRLADQHDQQGSFNPMDYLSLHGEDGISNEHADEIRNLMMRRFGLKQSDIEAYEKNGFSVLSGLSSNRGQRLMNDVSQQFNRMKEYGPKINTQLDQLRNAGMDDMLRELGVITNKNGIDTYNPEMFREALRRQLNGESAVEEQGRDTLDLPTISGDMGRGRSGRTDNKANSALNKLGDTIAQLNESMTKGFNVTPTDYSENFKGIDQQLDKANGFLSQLVEMGREQLEAVKNFKLTVTRGGKNEKNEESLLDRLLRRGKGQDTEVPPDESTVTEEGKRSRTQERVKILGHLKGLGGEVGSLLKGGLDKVLSNEPLMMGGFLGGLGGLMTHNPHVAIAAGLGGAAWMWYKQTSEMLDRDEVSDDEDIYTEDSPEPLLEARKLKAGQYFDNVSKTIIKSWREIKGAITDLGTKVIVSAKTLAGKLFGSDGRKVMIKGLSKAKDFFSSIFKKIDPLTKLRNIGSGMGAALYQMDVHLAGGKGAVLTRAGFKAGRYFKLVGDEYKVIKGWNEIDGPVYDEEGNTLVTQTDFDNGLVTSAGLKVDTLKSGLGKLGQTAVGKFAGLKTKFAPALDKAKAMVSADYSPITQRLDLIYAALCEKFGIEQKSLSGESQFVTENGQIKSSDQLVNDQTLQDELGDDYDDESTVTGRVHINSREDRRRKRRRLKAKERRRRASAQTELEELGNAEPNDPTVPPKLRANSLADQANKKRAEREKKYQESIIDIAQHMDDDKKPKEDKKKKTTDDEQSSGIFGKLVDFMKNPFGIASGFATLFKMAKGFFEVGTIGLPFIVKGVASMTKLLARIATGGRIGGGPDFDADGNETRNGRRRRRRGNRAPRGSRAARLGGLGKIGKGLGLAAIASFGVDAAEEYFDVDEDSTAGKVMNGAGTALNVVGGVQTATGIASALGVEVSAGAVASGLSTGVSAVAPLLFNPITLGAVAVAGAGYLIYKHYSKGKGDQYRLRLAQYGIKDPDSDMAMKIRVLEDKLKDYVLIRNGQGAFAQSTPLTELFKGIAPDPNDKVATKAFYTWFNLRFKPVYLSYCAGLDTAGFKSFEDYDKSQDPRMLSIASDINNAIGSISPYPFAVSEAFDAATPFMNVNDTRRVIVECLNNMKTYNKRHDRTDSGLMKEGVTFIPTTQEEAARNAKASGFEKAKLWLSGNYESVDDLKEINKKFPIPKPVSEISIKDLMPGAGKPMDFLTALRLAAYGNTDNVSWRVEAVLRLERYIEDYINVLGDDPRFTSTTGVVFNLFKNTFRLEEKDYENWLIWFRDRFLPVAMAWVKFVMQNRRVKPKDGWQTMSATSKYNFGRILSQLKSIGTKEVRSVWDVRQAPFGRNEISGGFGTREKAFLQNLQTVATDARMKDPKGEAAKTGAAEVAKLDNLHSMGKDGVNKSLATGDGPLAPELQAASMKPMTGNTDTSKVDLSGVHVDGGGQAYTGGSLTAGNDKGLSVPKKAALQLIMKNMIAAGFTDKRMIAGMLANLDYESGGFRHTAENMKYSPENLMKVFGKRIGSMANAQALSAQGPQAVANAVYGGRLGNSGPNDGWLYRGRGFIQLTGKANYEAAARDTGLDIVNHPELVSNDPNVAAKTAVWFLKTHKRLQSLPQNGFEYATAAINPALLGIDGRRSLYNQYLTQLSNGSLTVDGTADPATPDKGATTATPPGGSATGGNPTPPPVPESKTIGGGTSAGNGPVSTPATPAAAASQPASNASAPTPTPTPAPTPVRQANTPAAQPEAVAAAAPINGDHISALLEAQKTTNALLAHVVKNGSDHLDVSRQKAQGPERRPSTN